MYQSAFSANRLMTLTHYKGIRGFTIGVGVLAVIISVMILAAPVIGAIFAGLIIAMALLIIGIQMVAAGVAGRRESLVPSSTSKLRE